MRPRPSVCRPRRHTPLEVRAVLGEYFQGTLLSTMSLHGNPLASRDDKGAVHGTYSFAGQQEMVTRRASIAPRPEPTCKDRGGRERGEIELSCLSCLGHLVFCSPGSFSPVRTVTVVSTVL